MNEEKSTDAIERLKASNVEKLTLDGKKLHIFHSHQTVMYLAVCTPTVG